MKKLLLSTTAALVLTASAAFAQSIAEQVITQLQAEGYQHIEVKNGATQVKVEAIRDGMKLEVVYDAATGEILKQEVTPVGADDNISNTVSVQDDDGDYVDDGNDSNDEDDDGNDDSDDGNDDDGNDDNDDDSNDDNDDNDDDSNDDDDHDSNDDEGDDD